MRELRSGIDTDDGVGDPLSCMLCVRWVPICRIFVRRVGNDMVLPNIHMSSNEVMDHLGFPKFDWPPILISTKDSMHVRSCTCALVRSTLIVARAWNP